jgi:hypothetical protein
MFTSLRLVIIATTPPNHLYKYETIPSLEGHGANLELGID